MTEVSFRRIAVVNRGEPALRLIHAVRELNFQDGRDIACIVLYTDPDRHSLMVREADDAVHIGPASYTDAAGQKRSSYLDYDRLKKALIAARADAVWVGWGFVAEHAEFADLCEKELGLVFIGPTGDSMRKLGDKISAKRLAESAQVPVLGWSGGPVATVEDAVKVGERIGYPLVLKATAGGGGRGVRKIYDPKELEAAYKTARSEAGKAFGDDTVYMERMAQAARHIEVQMLADTHGTTWAVGVRDCTVQRRNQKVIEEAPSSVLDAETEKKIREAAIRLAKAASYRNAGTVELLYQPKTREFHFMEMNTRLQVEHPVTETTTGLDLVKLQIHVASGGKLEGEPPRCSGAAIEVRLNAEDPDNGFAPAPGEVELFRLATGPALRVDTGVAQGDVVPPDFDSMIAKLIVYGKDRDEAIARMKRALAESAVVIKGGTTNKAFLLEILSSPEFILGSHDTGWLDRVWDQKRQLPRAYGSVALLQAAIVAYQNEYLLSRAEFVATAARGRPNAKREIGLKVELRYGGNEYVFMVRRVDANHYRVQVDGQSLDLSIEQRDRFEATLVVGGRRHHVVSVRQGADYVIEVNGTAHRISSDAAGAVRAPAPALILSVKVQPGDMVKPGDELLVLEAMKMEMPVRAELSGRVRTVLAKPNLQVAAGTPLVLIEPEQRGETVTAGERLNFAALAEASAKQDEKQAARALATEALLELRRYVMGYDVQAKDVRARLTALQPHLQGLADDEALAALELEVLGLFGDVVALYHPYVGADAELRVSSADYLLFYLRALDKKGDGLPPRFLDTLKRALSHYGVTALVRSPELEDALLSLHRAHARLSDDVEPLLLLLDRPRGQPDPKRPGAEALSAILERLIDVTHGRFQAINDMARQTRYRTFERQRFVELRTQIYADMETRLVRLSKGLPPAEREREVRAISECFQPVLGLLGRWFERADDTTVRPLLEIFVRRFYAWRNPGEVTTKKEGDVVTARSQFVAEGKTTQVLAAFCKTPDLVRAIAALDKDLAQLPGADEAMLDFVVSQGGGGLSAEALQREVMSVLAATRWSRPFGRICVSLLDPAGQRQSHHFTYHIAKEGELAEIQRYRDVHPMLAGMLEFWRLRNFDTERLPSPEDIYVFRGTARDNPRDTRLVGIVHVRELAAARDEQGKIRSLPHLERMFMETVAAMRDYRSQNAKAHLHWNRIVLHVAPPLGFSPQELGPIIVRLAPATKNLGLEKVVARVRIEQKDGSITDQALHISVHDGQVVRLRAASPSEYPIRTLTPYTQKVAELRRRGLTYPYEIIRMLAPKSGGAQVLFPRGEFIEYDFDAAGELKAVDRPLGQNTANVVVGTITNFVPRYETDGVKRVILLGDPSQDMGALAEPECKRVIAGLDLAEKLGVPVDWFPISAGARIAMDSGTENLDWTAKAFRRIVTFTQAGGELNLVVTGINVGAQSYWNAMATMLMHTRGILVMTPEASMVLTGKQALDYSGGVSAEDNQGIGGVERIMGPNGEAQYQARDITDACQILLHHHELNYVAPGERFPRRAVSRDPVEREVTRFPYNGEGDFTTVGDIFSSEKNPGKKKPFDIRTVMQATIDQDQAHLERWAGWRGAETGIIWEARLGGYSVTLIGIESKRITRLGIVPSDGPAEWTGGTLFPLSSKKVARGINAASGRRPVCILANLSGFDGSPESLRKLQLEYGAEIGRAVVNFQGPIVFVVISRFHGGAYVVFSRALTENIELAAFEGAYASVIGGAPAAAVVFARDVKAQTYADPRVKEMQAAVEKADENKKPRLWAQLEEVVKTVHTEKLGQFAEHFDKVHSVDRALSVGSLDRVITPSKLRAYLVDAIERGMKKWSR